MEPAMIALGVAFGLVLTLVIAGRKHTRTNRRRNRHGRAYLAGDSSYLYVDGSSSGHGSSSSDCGSGADGGGSAGCDGGGGS